MKVHSKLGKGFKEIVYKDALEVEFLNNRIPYEKEKSFQMRGLYFRGGFTQIFCFRLNYPGNKSSLSIPL